MKIPYTLVSMAAILRDYYDPNYLNDEHYKLTSIADYLYNSADGAFSDHPEDNLLPEFKVLFDKYGADYFQKVLDDMYALDGQLTSDDKVQELFDDYVDRLDGVKASTKVTATKDNSYNQHLVQVSKEDKQYVLNYLNKSHKTVGMGGAGDSGYYVSEFEPAYGLYLWASDTGLRILDDNGIEYELVKKSVESSTVKASSGQSFEYQLLDRLKSDCEYVLAEYRRSETQGDSSREGRKLAQKFLWANNAKDQIAKMKELYRKLKVKPEWITLEDIAEYERQFKEILGKDYRGDHEYVGASNNPFYDKLSDKDKRFVKNTEKKIATEFSPDTFDVYNALLPYIGEYSSNTGWTGSCELMKGKDLTAVDGYIYNVVWDNKDVDSFTWMVNDNPRVGGDFTLMVMYAHGMPDFCDSEKDFYRAVRKVFGDGLKKINR